MTLADQISWLERLIADMHPIEPEPRDILATLRWVQKWEMVIRKAVADSKDLAALAESDPAVSALVEAFPQAQVTITTREPK